jgi:serine acetyltransferase
VTIGERAVIGANSVVSKDVPPYSIAAGAPARVLKQVEYGPAMPDIDVASAPMMPDEPGAGA